MPVFLSSRVFLPRNVQDKHLQFSPGLLYLRPVKDLHCILSVNVRRYNAIERHGDVRQVRKGPQGKVNVGTR